MKNSQHLPEDSSLHGAHVLRRLAQVLNDANDAILHGDLSICIPIPTNFDPHGQLVQHQLIDAKIIEACLERLPFLWNTQVKR